MGVGAGLLQADALDFKKDMAYYKKTAAQNGLTVNDKLYILRQLRLKHDGQPPALKAIDQEIARIQPTTITPIPDEEPKLIVKKEESAPASAAQNFSNYEIQVGDVISIDVSPADELSQESVVHPDGQISMPLVGNVPARGLTTRALADRLEQKLKRFVSKPEVDVSLKQFVGLQVFVMGEVRQGGPLGYRDGMRLLDAISQAGGFAERANRTGVKIYRGKGTTKKILTFNAQSILEKGDFSKDFLLAPGDIIEIDNQETSLYIVGQVAKPGNYNYREGLKVLEMVSLAGGFASDAKMSHVKIFREAAPERKVIRVNMKHVVQGRTQEDILLQPGDIVFVPQKAFNASTGFLTTNVLPWLTAAALAIALIL